VETRVAGARFSLGEGGFLSCRGARGAASLQRGGDYGADLLPLAERVRRAEVGTSEADEGTGEGEPAAEAVGG